MACVDLPAFPLQLLLKRHPDWKEHPAVVVDSDKPNGIILQVNERARSFRILPGMRYAAGLSLTRALRAAVLPQKELDQQVQSLARELRLFTPNVEPAADEPGVFWLDASGLDRLYESLNRWGGLVRDRLGRLGFQATVVVGFSRFGSYAVAKGKHGRVVFREPKEEQAVARRVALDRLSFPPAVRDTLRKLGVRSVGDFVDLPPAGIAKRFGSEVERLHRLATGRLQSPLRASHPVPPMLRRVPLEYPETRVPRLMKIIEQLVDPLLTLLDNAGQTLVEMRLGFRFERMGDHIETLRPAEPTLNARQLIELIRLRLQAVRKLPEGVVEVILAVYGMSAVKRQLQLLAGQPKRDLAAANRALARVWAELGEDSVRRARLREGHLPEASFTWDNLTALTPPKPRDTDRSLLVRRIYVPALPLPSRPRHEPDGWMLRDLKQGPVVRVLGPYVVSGGWWRRPIHREYHFAETQKGELLWVYYDRPRRSWFLQGRVE